MKKYSAKCNTDKIMKKIDFDKLRNSHFFNEYINYGKYDGVFDDFLLSIMILKDNNEKIESYLHFIKKIKEMTGLGLFYLNDYSDGIRELGFIDVNKNYNVFIKNEIFDINSSIDIINMIKYNMNINMFLRKKKINKLIKSI